MEEIPDDSLITCNVQQEPADVLIRLEVDTAEDVNTFNKDLMAAMTDALLSSFAFCTASRRLAKRSLVENDSPDFALSAVSVIEDPSGKSRFDLFVFQLFLPSGFILTSSSFADPWTDSCSPATNSPAATTCSVAILTLTAFGADAVQAAALVPAEVESILDNDQAFDSKLAEDGIVDVRLQESGEEDAPNSSSSGGGSDNTRTAVVAILSVAAVTVLAAVVIRKLFNKRGGPAAATAGKDGSDTGSEGETLDNAATV
jgi:hypothetical protein